MSEFYFEKDIELKSNLDELSEQLNNVIKLIDSIYNSGEETDYSYDYLKRLRRDCEDLLDKI